MEVSSIYNELRVYRYTSPSEVDGEATYSNSGNNYFDVSNKKRELALNEQKSSSQEPQKDKLEISDTAKKTQQENKANPQINNSKNNSQTSGKAGNSNLSEDQKKIVEELSKRDKEVRAHEAAHVAAGGNLIRGGTTFEYQSGPDGKQYAIGGEVKIDTSSSPDNPDETIRKMQQIKSAALAPSDPSSQDRAVAQMASSNEAKARADIQKKSEQTNEKIIEQTSKEDNKPEVKIPTSGEKSESEKVESESKDNGNKLITNIIKSYKKSEKSTSETIGNIINKINAAPSLDNLQTFTLRTKPKQILY